MAGIEVRHSRSCRFHDDGRCNCERSYRANVWDHRRRKLIKKTFRNPAEAKAWHQDALVALRRGTLQASSATTITEAGEALITGMRDGTIRNRSGQPYKPSAIRAYERALRLHLSPLGSHRVSDLRRNDVQDLIDRMLADGASASTIKNTLDPLRVIYRRAIRRDEVSVDPTHELDIPADRGRRDRFAGPDEAALLIASLPNEDRALWATALYTGMRRGELRELRCSDYDRAENVITVRRALDDDGTVILTKTYAGDRDVPVIPTLKPVLAAHLLRTGRTGDDLLFGRTSTLPFIPSTVRHHARAAWKAHGLEPITLHEARHSTASMLRAAGIDFKLISTIVGHASVTITQDRYTHVNRDHLRGAGAQLNAYLERSAGKTRETDAPLHAVDSGRER